jgi:hypothetical protein
MRMQKTNIRVRHLEQEILKRAYDIESEKDPECIFYLIGIDTESRIDKLIQYNILHRV